MRRLAVAIAFGLYAACAPATDGTLPPDVPERVRPPASREASVAALPVRTEPEAAISAHEPVYEARDEPFVSERGERFLEGILSLPRRLGERRVPGVVLIHGSGPLSRDGIMRGQLGLGFGFEIAVYAELAEALRQSGFAILRYDKRTCGRFNGCAENGYPTVPYALQAQEFSIRALMEDAAHAMSVLAGRPEIDPAQLYFIGHSQGGGFVPELLTELADVRAGVMLAPPYNTADTLIDNQGRLAWRCWPPADRRALHAGKEIR